MIPAFIGLGSNLQNPLQQLQAGVDAIAQLPQSRLVKVSAVYRSEALGPGQQPDYLNAVLRLDTSVQPAELLVRLQDIEQTQGRVRVQRWGPRTLDLDILLYGDQMLKTPLLSIPHLELGNRNFVLYPLAEIAGSNWVLPDGRELATLLDRCPRGDLQLTALTLNPSG